MHKPISQNPLITALAAHYAGQIKSLKEAQESEIESLYLEFSRKYQLLKRIIEDQEGNRAKSLDGSSPVTPAHNQTKV